MLVLSLNYNKVDCAEGIQRKMLAFISFRVTKGDDTAKEGYFLV